MSYAANIMFKKDIQDLNDFISFVEEFKNKINVDKWLKDNEFQLLFLDEDVKKDQYKVFHLILKSFSQTVFKFFYWKDYKMIGVYFETRDEEVKNLFDGEFYFQNSTDQDYELSKYDFLPKELIEYITDFQEEDVFNHFKIDEEEHDNAILDEDCYDYYKLTYVYERLVTTLNLCEEFWTSEMKNTEKTDIQIIFISPFAMAEYDATTREKFWKFVEKTLKD